MTLCFTADLCSSHLLVKPGGGEEVVYAPAGQNVTLTCTVNSSILVWDVNGLRFAESTSQLHRDGVFQNHVLVLIVALERSEAISCEYAICNNKLTDKRT